MKDRLLYFPYIRIPESTWLTQSLLYWDQVLSIVPSEFTSSPESLGPYMQRLVQEELVHQVIPGVHIPEIHNFEGAFHDYIYALGPRLDHRRAEFLRGYDSVSMIHMEKMGQIASWLVDQGLARAAERLWYKVEKQTANDFMFYLAATLGQLASVDSSPITDDPVCLEDFAIAGVAEDQRAQQLQSFRILILDQILPVPDHPIDPREIRIFRDRHPEVLAGFRRRVEQTLDTILATPDEFWRQRQLHDFLEEAAQSTEEFQAWMGDAGWRTVKATLSVLATTLFAATPGHPWLFGLAGAVLAAFSGRQDHPPSLDFAYAAYAREELRLPGHIFGPAGKLLPGGRPGHRL